MRKKTFIIGALFLAFLAVSGFTKVSADPYDCQHYGTHQCINLTGSAKCVNGEPQVTLNWNNPHNDSTFNIVYSHDGHWYMKPIWNKVLTTTIPPYGAHQDGGTAGDPGFSATGGYFGAKITGGIPYSSGGSGITTGYSTPDWSTTMPDCTIKPTTPPTQPPTPTANPTPTTPPTPPGPTTPPGTTGILALQIQGIGLSDNNNPLHPNRRIVLYFYPPKDTTFQQKPQVFTGIVTYNPTTGNFSNASFPLTGLLAGQYLVLARTPEGSLVSQIGTGDGTGPITIVTTGGQNYLVDTQNQQDQNADTTVPALAMANIGQSCDSGNCSFNVIDLLDFNAFVDCFGDKSITWDCLVHGIFPQTSNSLTDINDDGKVDGIDFTMMMKNFGHYGIGQNTMNRGGENIDPITPTPPPPTPTSLPTVTPTCTPRPACLDAKPASCQIALPNMCPPTSTPTP